MRFDTSKTPKQVEYGDNEESSVPVNRQHDDGGLSRRAVG